MYIYIYTHTRIPTYIYIYIYIIDRIDLTPEEAAVLPGGLKEFAGQLAHCVQSPQALSALERMYS